MSLTKTRRYRVFERDNWTCRYCKCLCARPRGDRKATANTATIDHIKPSSLGGTDSVRNLTTACWKCNQSKGSLWREFNPDISFPIPDWSRARDLAKQIIKAEYPESQLPPPIQGTPECP